MPHPKNYDPYSPMEMQISKHKEERESRLRQERREELKEKDIARIKARNERESKRLSPKQEQVMNMLREGYLLRRVIYKGKVDQAMFEKDNPPLGTIVGVPSNATIDVLINKGLIKKKIVDQRDLYTYDEVIEMK
jgi:hypothetical protein